MVVTSTFIIMYLFPNINPMLAVTAITLAIIWLISKLLELRKLPPGPYGLPIVGYLPFLTKDPHITFMKMAKKYGDVFSIKIGFSNVIIISNYEIFKKTVNNPIAYSRPNGFLKIIPGKGGLVSKNGKDWLEQRRFTFTAMKDLGMGRGVWETMIQDSSQEFAKELKTWKGKPIDFGELLKFSQMDNTLSLIFGKGIFKSRADPNFEIFEKFADDVVPFLNASSLLNNAPAFILKLLRILKVGGFDELYQILEDYESFVEKEVRSHMAKPIEEKNASYLDHYLQQFMSENHDDTEEDTIVFNLLGNIGSLFLGSVDTTQASMQWLLFLVAAFPEIQSKIHQEIDDVIGKDNLIFWDERHNLPYTFATINEMQRWAAIAPLFPPRWTIEAMEVGGYTIPKGTTIIGNNYSMLHDPRYHENPDDFKPERFLSSSSKRLIKVESYFPFSTGKRNCPGEHVATMTTFLYFSAIMQKFKIVCPEGKTIILEDRGESAVRHPIPQKLCFIER